MKSFKRIVTEVAQPKGEDEIDFKAKHELELIDEPNAEESQFDGGTKKTKPRKADYVDGEDEAVYESTDEENLYEAAAKGPFTWEQINTAMMTAGFNPPQILKLLSALNKTVKEDVSEAASEDAKAAYRKRAAAAVVKKTQDNRIKAATGGLPADYWDKKIAAMKAGVKKEDVQLDELSSDTLKNYVSAAVKSAGVSRGKGTAQLNKANAAFARGDNEMMSAHDDAAHAHYNKARSRQANIGLAKSKIKEDVQLDEVVRKLDKVNHVHVFDDHPESEHFAKAYVKAHIGDHRQGGPKEGDEKNSDKFHSEYDRKTIRGGFAGSGTHHYTHKTTGHSFEVSKVPNGKTFYGTDHNIRKLKTDAKEAVELEAGDNLDEARTMKTGFIKDHAWIGKKVKHRDGRVGTVKHVDREPTFSQMHPYKLNVHIDHGDGKTSHGRKDDFRVVKEDAVVEAFDIDSVNFLEVAEATGVNPNREPNFDHNPKSLVISKEAAIKRIREAGLTIAKAVNMPDNELLKHPSIGRKTLRWIRDFKVTEETLEEAAAFASGTVKFGDGKTGNVKEQDASILNTLYDKLKRGGTGSHEDMHKHAMENQKNFKAVVEFAISTVGKK